MLVPALFSPPIVFGKAIQFRHRLSIYSDGRNGGLKHPEGIACGDSAGLVVADSGNGRLLRYVFEKNALNPAATVFEVPQLVYPVKIEISAKGDMYVLDGRQRRIIRLGSDGSFRGYLEPQGVPGGNRHVPRSFSLGADDKIYILDILSERVLVLNPDGGYVKQVDFPEKFGFFSDLTVDDRGNILIVDSIDNMLFSARDTAARVSPLTSALKQYMRYPAGITTDARGRIYLVDRNGGQVVILGQDGSYLSRQSTFGWKEGHLNFPAQACINEQNEVFIADTLNSRVQIFQIIE